MTGETNARWLGVLLSREVLVSLLLVGVAGAALGTTTWAYFSDADDSTGNALQGGTLDLSLDGGDSQSATFSISQGAPNDSATHNFTLENRGSVAADHVEVALSVSENDPGSEPGDADLNVELNATETASLVEVTTFEYRNESGTVIEDVLSSVSDANGNGIVDLEDVSNQASATDGLAAPQPNGGNSTHLVVGVAIANDDDGTFVAEGNTGGNLTGYDEDVMADGVDVTVTVTLNQDASQ